MDTVKGGEVYRHFKGHRYRVLSIGRHTETLDEYVVYQNALLTDDHIWIRSLSNFTEFIQRDGQNIPRFELCTHVTADEVHTALDAAWSVLSTLTNHSKPTVDIKLTSVKTYWALIRLTGANRYTLSINSLLFDLLTPTERCEKLANTCMHELIHTLPGCMNHGVEFHNLARRVHEVAPQYNVTTASELDKYGIELPPSHDKYSIKCCNCGETWRYQRAPAIWKYIENGISKTPYTCGSCGQDIFEGVKLDG